MQSRGVHVTSEVRHRRLPHSASNQGPPMNMHTRWNCGTAGRGAAPFSSAPNHHLKFGLHLEVGTSIWFNWVQLRCNYTLAKHLIVLHPDTSVSWFACLPQPAGLDFRREWPVLVSHSTLSLSSNLNYFHDGRGHTLTEQSWVVGRVLQCGRRLFSPLDKDTHALTMFLLIVLLLAWLQKRNRG